MIKIISNPLSQKELEEFLGKPYEEMIKFVADTRQGILALGGELHADAEASLIEKGSLQEDLWGGNYHPKKSKDQRIEYTSFINIRPSQGNRSLEVQDTKIRSQMQALVEKYLP